MGGVEPPSPGEEVGTTLILQAWEWGWAGKGERRFLGSYAQERSW